MKDKGVLIAVDAVPASDGWGFVGRVLIGDHEAYRTLRACPTPTEALDSAKHLLAGVLGSFLAGQEWHVAADDVPDRPSPASVDAETALATEPGPLEQD